MGYHNQGHDSSDPVRQTFFMGINHICMDWEPFMLLYRAGQFFVGATLNMYPGPKGDRQNYEGLSALEGKCRQAYLGPGRSGPPPAAEGALK